VYKTFFTSCSFGALTKPLVLDAHKSKGFVRLRLQIFDLQQTLRVCKQAELCEF
jgi:hypothetical protein